MGNDISSMWHTMVDPLGIFGLQPASVGEPFGQGLINGSMGASKITPPKPGSRMPQQPYNMQGLWGFMGEHPMLQGQRQRMMYQPQRQGLM